MSETWETRGQLLDAAADAGLEVSGPQLGRYHRAGLVPSPVTRSLGRGQGTESRFPPGSTARLIRVAQIHATFHRLADVAWRLWWEDGGEMTPLAREALRKVAAAHDAQREWLAKVLADSAAGDEAVLSDVLCEVWV